ncbi:hypothetical protein C8J57DRAFT_1618109 [Mycena rebaudengoi]|nr:hypothetical protein C8J57DRAFT_1618109 [Mycena rebaudengoi]
MPHKGKSKAGGENGDLVIPQRPRRRNAGTGGVIARNERDSEAIQHKPSKKRKNIPEDEDINPMAPLPPKANDNEIARVPPKISPKANCSKRPRPFGDDNTPQDRFRDDENEQTSGRSRTRQDQDEGSPPPTRPRLYHRGGFGEDLEATDFDDSAFNDYIREEEEEDEREAMDSDGGSNDHDLKMDEDGYSNDEDQGAAWDDEGKYFLKQRLDLIFLFRWLLASNSKIIKIWMIMMIVIKTNPTRPPGLPTSNSKIVKVKDDTTIDSGTPKIGATRRPRGIPASNSEIIKESLTDRRTVIWAMKRPQEIPTPEVPDSESVKEPQDGKMTESLTACTTAIEATKRPQGIPAPEPADSKTVETVIGAMRPQGIPAPELADSEITMIGAMRRPQGITTLELADSEIVKTEIGAMRPQGIPAPELADSEIVKTMIGAMRPQGIPTPELADSKTVKTVIGAMSPQGIPAPELADSKTVKTMIGAMRRPQGIPVPELVDSEIVKRDNEIDVLHAHHRKNRPSKPPVPEKLRQSAQKQAEVDDENTDGDEDCMEEEDTDRPGRARRTAREAVPTQVQFHPGPWREVLENAKLLVRVDLLYSNFFPEKERYLPRCQTFIADCINEAIDDGKEDDLTSEYWLEYKNDMIILVWNEVATFRGRAKTLAKAIVLRRYKIFPTATEFDGRAFGQAEYQELTKDNVAALLHEGHFHKNGKDSDGRTNNMAHPAFQDLLSQLVFNTGGTSGSDVKKSIGGRIPTFFTAYKAEHIAAAGTAIWSALNDYKHGYFLPVKFTHDLHASFYRGMLTLIEKTLANSNHGPKTKATWAKWRKEVRFQTDRAEPTPEDFDLAVDLD